LFALCVVLLGASATPQCRADETIKLVIPFPPGSGTDIMARLLAEQVRLSGPVVVVENKPGAGTVLAADFVARRPPNGNTLLLIGNALVINPPAQLNILTQSVILRKFRRFSV